MLPLPVLVLGAAAGGALIFRHFSRAKTAAIEEDSARRAALNMAATEFEQGKTYAVQLMVTNVIGTKDVPTASAVIKSTMEQLGWKVLSTPQFRNPAGGAPMFAAGQPTEWVFQGQWTLAKKFMDVVPPWLGSAIAFKLPVA